MKEIYDEYCYWYRPGRFSICCAGTDARLYNYIRYTTGVKLSSGSRVSNTADVFLHIVSMNVPQLHPSKTNRNYFKFGIDSYDYDFTNNGNIRIIQKLDIELK